MSATVERQPCPHGRDVCRDCDRYWWHKAIADELRRLADLGHDGYNVPGIAGNLRGVTRSDCEQYVAQMVAWGELEPSAPLWDYPATWVRLVNQ